MSLKDDALIEWYGHMCKAGANTPAVATPARAPGLFGELGDVWDMYKNYSSLSPEQQQAVKVIFGRLNSGGQPSTAQQSAPTQAAQLLTNLQREESGDHFRIMYKALIGTDPGKPGTPEYTSAWGAFEHLVNVAGGSPAFNDYAKKYNDKAPQGSLNNREVAIFSANMRHPFSTAPGVGQAVGEERKRVADVTWATAVAGYRDEAAKGGGQGLVGAFRDALENNDRGQARAIVEGLGSAAAFDPSKFSLLGDLQAAASGIPQGAGITQGIQQAFASGAGWDKYTPRHAGIAQYRGVLDRMNTAYAPMVSEIMGRGDLTQKDKYTQILALRSERDKNIGAYINSVPDPKLRGYLGLVQGQQQGQYKHPEADSAPTGVYETAKGETAPRAITRGEMHAIAANNRRIQSQPRSAPGAQGVAMQASSPTRSPLTTQSYTEAEPLGRAPHRVFENAPPPLVRPGTATRPILTQL